MFGLLVKRESGKFLYRGFLTVRVNEVDDDVHNLHELTDDHRVFPFLQLAVQPFAKTVVKHPDALRTPLR